MIDFSGRLLCVICCLSLSITLFAEEFFVSSASEISSTLAIAQPGDTLTMTNGRWTDVDIRFDGNGTEEAPILLRAQTPGRVILDGSSQLRIGGNWMVVDGLFFTNGGLGGDHVIRFRNNSSANNCRLTNTAIVDYNPESINTRYFWVSLYGTNNRVDHCYFSGQNHSGVTVVAWLDGIETNHRIDNNVFANRPVGPSNGWETIRIGTSSESGTNSKVIVENNYFYKCDGEIEIISNKSNENIYRYNTFEESNGQLTLRHGKRCTVEGNFFLGNNVSGSSGVRIIDRDHVVMNNYFENLDGSGFRAALSITNGVPNSPLNRYFQVINARVLNNTFVNCTNPFDIGSGMDAELSLPPLDCIIANNVVQSTDGDMIDYTDTPINMTYEGNIVFGALLGIDPDSGLIEIDPLLTVDSTGLFRPDPLSPVIDAALGDYPEVLFDMDGQPRDSSKDVGADEVSSELITNRPLTADDVGPDWYPLVQRIIQVPPGHNTLSDSLANALTFDILELQPGEYTLDEKLIINQPLTFRSNDPENRPVLRNISTTSSTRIIFEIQNGGSLTLEGLELDGMAGTDTPAKYLIRTDDDPFDSKYVLKVDNCYFHDVVLFEDGNFFRAYAGTFADSIIFTNSLFKNSGKEGIRLRDEADDSGEFNVDILEIRNCTFWETTKEAVYVYAGDSGPFTVGPKITIDHCTFDNCGSDGSRILYLRECDQAKVKNSIFSNSPGNSEAIILAGISTTLSYSDTFNVGPVSLNRSAAFGAGIVSIDPDYADPGNGDFMLPAASPLAGLADDGQPLGDLRWAQHLLDIENDATTAILPDGFLLEQNFPNPFNPSSIIRFGLPTSAQTKLAIYNTRGQLVQILLDEFLAPNTYEVTWEARNLPSGIYYYQLIADGQMIETRKAILLK